jgi:hypothetical protein
MQRLKYKTIILPLLFSFLQNVIRRIKSKSVRWAGHVALMGEMRKIHTKF